MTYFRQHQTKQENVTNITTENGKYADSQRSKSKHLVNSLLEAGDYQKHIIS